MIPSWLTMAEEPFESMLTGGHPNSLGRTLEVVEIVLNDKTRLEALYRCYFSEDEVVRLRTSSAVKRVTIARPEWLEPYLDRFLGEITQIDQASTQWTLALLFDMLSDRMTSAQRSQATAHLKNTLATHVDWIVLSNTMKTLTKWATKDESLRAWLQPHLLRLTKDERKTVMGNAYKSLGALKLATL